MIYRRKPLEVEAWRISSKDAIPAWVKTVPIHGEESWSYLDGLRLLSIGDGCWTQKFVKEGDWLIKDEQGAYSMPDAVFKNEYEAINAQSSDIKEDQSAREEGESIRHSRVKVVVKHPKRKKKRPTS